MTVEPAEVVRRYFERLLVDRDLSVCDELLAEDYVDHDAPAGTPPGSQATRRYVEGMLRDYPDLEFTIEELISQGAAVAIRATWCGTHRGTGVALRQAGLVFLHVNDAGQIMERWSAYVPGGLKDRRECATYPTMCGKTGVRCTLASIFKGSSAAPHNRCQWWVRVASPP